MPEERAAPRWRRALGELLIIIFGVLIALWAENWRQSGVSSPKSSSI